jgi:phosphoacetylglucosamine mutase
MKNSSITIKLAKTGVKFVEHEAKTFDIGMYFEANGHGTVIFSPAAVKALEAARPRTNKLLGFYKLINQAVGDAISDCLGVEAVLACLGLTIEQWDDLYEDLPSRQGKIAIADRTLIKCTEDETRILSPASLQEEIDDLVSRAGPQARAFVRPSGTEDAARIYAEAMSTEKANHLAYLVAQAAWRAVGKEGSMEPQAKEYM